jgi:hypothetical protein
MSFFPCQVGPPASYCFSVAVQATGRSRTKATTRMRVLCMGCQLRTRRPILHAQ